MDNAKTTEKTYMTIDGVYLNLDDMVWIAAIDTDSFNYVPAEYSVRRCLNEKQTAFWSSYEKALEECDNANSL